MASETLADILAEMRDEMTPVKCAGDIQSLHETQDLLRNLADRIERANVRLRDIVWRLAEYADAVTAYRPRILEVVSSDHPAWTFDGAALLREARAAIGEARHV